MLDQIAVYRELNEWGSPDPSTGVSQRVRELKFRTKAKILSGAAGTLIPTAREALEGGREVTTTRSIIKVPADGKVYEANDVIHVEAIHELSDVILLGKEFKIIAPVAGSYNTQRSYAIEAVVA